MYSVVATVPLVRTILCHAVPESTEAYGCCVRSSIDGWQERPSPHVTVNGLSSRALGTNGFAEPLLKQRVSQRKFRRNTRSIA